MGRKLLFALLVNVKSERIVTGARQRRTHVCKGRVWRALARNKETSRKLQDLELLEVEVRRVRRRHVVRRMLKAAKEMAHAREQKGEELAAKRARWMRVKAFSAILYNSTRRQKMREVDLEAGMHYKRHVFKSFLSIILVRARLA